MSQNLNENQNVYGQNSYQQNPYQNNPYQNSGYGQNVTQNTYEQNSYQQNPYQSNPYQNPYGNDNGYNPASGTMNDTYSPYNTPSTANPNAFTTLKRVCAEEVVAKSFLFMFFALMITAFAAFTVTPEMSFHLLTSSAYIGIFIAEIAIVIISNIAIRKNHAILATILFTIYSYLTGATLSFIFSLYTASSLVATFVCTASIFAVMAIIGLVTKKDLTRFGGMFLMALIGTMIASFVNIVLLHSNSFDLLISIVCILIFVGLTAYDTQKIKRMVASSTTETVNCLALYGAFELYLDFVNMFLRILRILGKRK